MAAIDLISKALWFRAKDLGTGSVTSWPDQSGNGRNATLSGCTVATSSTPLSGKSVNGTTMAASVSTLGMVQGTYVHVSGPATSVFVPAHLTDGDASTLWSAPAGGSLPITVTYRIRTGADALTYTTATITEYTIRNGGTASNSPTAWTFQGSNDGSSWTTLDTVTGATTTANTSTAHSFSNSTAYQYYKWVITAVNGGSQAEWLMATLTGVSTGKTQLDGELWVVIKRDTANSTAWRLGTSGSSSHWDFSGTVYDDTGATSRQSFAPSLAITSWRIYRVRVQGTNWTAYIDGNAQSGSSSSITKSWQTSAPAPFVGQSGWIAEWILFDHALDSTEVTTVNDYLTAEHITAPPTTGAIATTLPSLTSALTGVVTRDGPIAVTLPSLTTALTGTVTGEGSLSTTLPSLTTALTGTVTQTGALAATLPPLTTALTGDVITPGSLAVTLPSLTADLTGTLPGAGSATGELATTLPSLSVSLNGANLSPTIATSLAYSPSGAIAVIPLIPDETLPDAVGITRTSYLMAPLTADHPTHDPQACLEGDTEVIREVVGYPHLFIGGRDVTSWRGQSTIVKRWESETPFGDTAAAFEFPQRQPWETPGVGDLDFLAPDAPVAIVMVEDEGSTTRRLWNGFLDARGNGLVGESEDYTCEAKGTLWAAQHQPHEPVPFTEPTDIWVLIARTLNSVIGRRWADIPETPIGIKTMTRGSRKDTKMEHVQNLLSEALSDDGRQWTIHEPVQGIFQPVLKPAPTTVHATVAYGTDGVDIDIRVDESTRIDGLYVDSVAPGGGGWANVYYPGLELINPPPYPNNDASNIVVGDTDADTSSGSGVSDLQRRINEIGAFGTYTVTGVWTSAWSDRLRLVQAYVGITVDGSPGPQTWNAVFDRGNEGIDLTPIRLPLVTKPDIMPKLYTATGLVSGDNPAYVEGAHVARMPSLTLPPYKTKNQGRAIAQTILDTYGEAGAYGEARWENDPNETDRTRLSHLSNVKILGHEGVDRTVQVASKVVELEPGSDGTGPLYVVTTRFDEHARDAMWVEDLLQQRRDAQADISRRPGDPSRRSRTTDDQRMPWDAESPCGVLRRTAVNGAAGLWSLITVPFAEVGKLARIHLEATHPFAFCIVASLRMTENDLDDVMGDPFASTDSWRPNKDALDAWGIVEAWGESGDACGYSPGTESDGYSFTGDFDLDTPVDYWTETPPYVQIGLFMRDASGFVEGRFYPAFES